MVDRLKYPNAPAFPDWLASIGYGAILSATLGIVAGTLAGQNRSDITAFAAFVFSVLGPLTPFVALVVARDWTQAVDSPQRGLTTFRLLGIVALLVFVCWIALGVWFVGPFEGD